MRNKSAITRRQVLSAAAMGSVGAVAVGCVTERRPLDPVSEEALIAASALSGAPLTADRVRGQKPFFDFVMKEIKLMREFDPGAEDLPAVFRIE